MAEAYYIEGQVVQDAEDGESYYIEGQVFQASEAAAPPTITPALRTLSLTGVGV